MFCHIKKSYDRKEYGTMHIIFCVLLGLINNLMAQDMNNSAPQSPAMPLSTQSSTYPPNRAIDIKTKPMMCEISEGIETLLNNAICIPKLEPKYIPEECQVLVFEDFAINNQSKITCNHEYLQQLTAVRPVIVALNRNCRSYDEWSNILASSELTSQEINALIEFAQKYKVSGFRLEQLSPQNYGEVLDVTVATNIIPYIQQLKAANLIVGYSVDVYPSVIKNKCVTNFPKLNEIVDYYEFKTWYLNDCISTIYNGLTPVNIRSHGFDYMISMEEVVKFVQASTCDLTKAYYTVEMAPYNGISLKRYITYSEICSGHVNKDMCIPDTKQYFSKGYFIKMQSAGVNIRYVNLDDILGTCKCGPFVGLKNVYAGYNDQDQISCACFDIQPNNELE